MYRRSKAPTAPCLWHGSRQDEFLNFKVKQTLKFISFKLFLYESLIKKMNFDTELLL